MNIAAYPLGECSLFSFLLKIREMKRKVPLALIFFFFLLLSSSAQNLPDFNPDQLGVTQDKLYSTHNLPYYTHDQLGCPSTCGNITVPYPFGIAEGCYFSGFNLTCERKSNSSANQKLFLSTSKGVAIEVSAISLEAIFVHAPVVAGGCPDGHMGDGDTGSQELDLRGLPYTVSYNRNILTVLGCGAVGASYGPDVAGNVSGCESLCHDVGKLVTNGTCTPYKGCCQAALPRDSKHLEVKVWPTESTTFLNSSANWKNDGLRCRYAFWANKQAYQFSTTDLHGLGNRTTMPLVLDWAIGTSTCEQARGNYSLYKCRENSSCVDSNNGQGYRCVCNSGYLGNPYLLNGCQDIDECEVTSNPCVATCINTPGSYACFCPRGTAGDGKKSGTGCVATRNYTFLVLTIAVSVLSCILVGLFCYRTLKSFKIRKQRQNNFQQNGGCLLSYFIHVSGYDNTRIFSEPEIEAATSKFSNTEVVGRGSFGTVYKGVLSDGVVVAVKRFNYRRESSGTILTIPRNLETAIDPSEHFAQEFLTVSRIKHVNTVRLLGCCLETPVPLLVYEFVPNGTLFDHLHVNRGSVLTWPQRMEIARGVASALVHLHSIQIYHGDIKSSNVLLDMDFTAKISDFGESRIMWGHSHSISTERVVGTPGYIDPHFLTTGIVTVKSDVYSFGVLLAEILTGKMPMRNPLGSGAVHAVIFTTWFIQTVAGDPTEVIDERVVGEANREQVISIAEVAVWCLNDKPEDRPTMRDVLVLLEVCMRKVPAPTNYNCRTPPALKPMKKHKKWTKYFHGALNTFR